MQIKLDIFNEWSQISKNRKQNNSYAIYSIHNTGDKCTVGDENVIGAPKCKIIIVLPQYWTPSKVIVLNLHTFFFILYFSFYNYRSFNGTTTNAGQSNAGQTNNNFINLIIILNNKVDTWSRSRSPFRLRFSQGPILVQINLQHSQAQPYGICTRVIYLTQTHYMWSITLRCSQYHF